MHLRSDIIEVDVVEMLGQADQKVPIEFKIVHVIAIGVVPAEHGDRHERHPDLHRQGRGAGFELSDVAGAGSGPFGEDEDGHSRAQEPTRHPRGPAVFGGLALALALDRV